MTMVQLLKSNLQIAIDGPVGAGKSIVANLLSKKLGIVYVYTGAMYRAVAYLGLQAGVPLENEDAILDLLQKVTIKLKPTDQEDRVCTVLIDDQDVTEALFTPEASAGSSQVAVHPKIRAELVTQQQRMADDHAVIMEGRDITTVVLPKADLKIFMTADVKIRAQRRLEDLVKKGYPKTLDEVIAETEERDYQDSHRAADPLVQASDAWYLDTTDLSISQVIELICDKLKEKNLIAYES
ncbi:(d)CMP kinase [Candidatus Beckwithbacteria bacterium]|nr:(d)CMP kinase [Candidatus Beckwithbacteria bacterium]